MGLVVPLPRLTLVQAVLFDATELRVPGTDPVADVTFDSGVEDVELLVAVDESLGVGEAIEARDHRAIPYSGTVRIKDVRDALRTYEDELVAESAAELPDEIVPEVDAISLETLARERGVSEDAVEGKAFPDNERVGRTLLRPGVLDDLRADIEDGMAFSAVEDLLRERGIEDASALLLELGYAVEWEGLGGGTVWEKDTEQA